MIRQVGDTLYACFGNAQWTLASAGGSGITLADLEPIKQKLDQLQQLVGIMIIFAIGIMIIFAIKIKKSLTSSITWNDEPHLMVK